MPSTMGNVRWQDRQTYPSVPVSRGTRQTGQAIVSRRVVPASEAVRVLVKGRSDLRPAMRRHFAGRPV